MPGLRIACSSGPLSWACGMGCPCNSCFQENLAFAQAAMEFASSFQTFWWPSDTNPSFGCLFEAFSGTLSWSLRGTRTVFRLLSVTMGPKRGSFTARSPCLRTNFGPLKSHAASLWAARSFARFRVLTVRAFGQIRSTKSAYWLSPGGTHFAQES